MRHLDELLPLRVMKSIIILTFLPLVLLHGGHFEKRPSWLAWVQFQVPRYPKMFIIYQSICVPILVLLSKNERLGYYAAALTVVWVL